MADQSILIQLHDVSNRQDVTHVGQTLERLPFWGVKVV